MSEDKQTVQDGLLVMFEGIDGSGKTTQIQLSEQKLQSSDWSITTTRSLGGTPIGEALRTVMLQSISRPAMTDLYISLAIQEALIESIATARTRGSIILLDRGPLSIAAYQIYGSYINESIGWRYADNQMKRLAPDLVIVYVCDPKQALERARRKSGTGDYFENMPLDYFERVARGYQAASKRYESVVIDASQSIDAVRTQTMQHIDKLLQEKTS